MGVIQKDELICLEQLGILNPYVVVIDFPLKDTLKLHYKKLV